MKRFGANQWLALMIGGLSLVYLYAAYQIPVFPIPRPVDSDAIPKLLGYMMVGLSLWLFFERDATAVADDTQEPAAQEAFWRRPWTQVVTTAVVIAIYAVALKPLGFLLASVLLVAGLAWYYGYRQHLVNAVVSVAIPLVLYLVLTRAMAVHLPRGIVPF